MRMPCERKPISMREAFCRLRRNSPVAHSRTSDMAICATTRTLRRLQMRPGRASASSPLRPLAMMGRAAAHAGARPNSRPAADAEERRCRAALANRRVTVRSRGTGAGRRNAAKAAGGPERKHDAEQAAAEGQQHAFRQHLAQQVAARGAQGEPHGHLAPAAGGLRQRQVGHVGAGDRRGPGAPPAESAGEKHQHRGPDLWEAASRRARSGSRRPSPIRDGLGRGAAPARRAPRRPGRA